VPPGAADIIDTLSVPLANFQDGRFIQPLFKATYWEALVIPVPGGGLSGPHAVKLSFNKGQGWEFYEAVEEVKARAAEANEGQFGYVEALRTCSTRFDALSYL
jgi:hypothetical protein